MMRAWWQGAIGPQRWNHIGALSFMRHVPQDRHLIHIVTVRACEALAVDELTPLKALTRLYELQRKARER